MLHQSKGVITPQGFDQSGIDRIETAIENQLSNPHFGITQLAEFLQVYECQLRKYFTRSTGYSFSNFIKKKRLEKAEELLRNSQLPVKNIAFDTGFSSYPSFWKCFVPQYDCSPLEYRKRYAEASIAKEVDWSLDDPMGSIESLDEVLDSEEWLLQLLQVLLRKIDQSDLAPKIMSQELCLSYSQLSRRLKSILGITPMRWFLHLRLIKSMDLLNQETDYSVTRIAYMSGFFDAAHFCRWFKQELGCRPLEYRKTPISTLYLPRLISLTERRKWP